MVVQARIDIDTTPFVLSGLTLAKDNETILQDAGRTEPLVTRTLMAQVAATKKWVPFTDETATDGTAIAKGVFMGDDIAAADLVAGDVTGVLVLVGGGAATIAADKPVIEASKTLDTVVGSGTLDEHRVEDDLNRIGLYAESTVDISNYENS